MRRVLSLFAAACAFGTVATAGSLETSGKLVAYAMPISAAAVTIYKKDWDGLLQLTVVTGLTYGTAYGLKQLVKSCRPYAKPCVHGGPGWDSFPSTTSALSSAPSSFLWRRYGWEWGLPAFIISKYPSYALQHSHKNKLVDSLATMGISWGYNYLLTTRYHKPAYNYPERGFYSGVDGNTDGLYATVGYRF